MDVNLTGAANFRDLRSPALRELALRPRVLYRSDHLGALDDEDARQLRALGIRRVLDFRGAEERLSAACALDGVDVHSLAIEPTIVQALRRLVDEGAALAAGDVVALMQDTYRGFVRGNTHRFGEFFAHLLESDVPTVFHCTAGKDRTGLAAALLLHSLGASRDDVLRDYLLTNERLKPLAHAQWTLPRHVVEVLYRVQPEFLDAAYEAIESDWGSLESYLREGLGLRDAERKRLAQLYLA